ncbi:MAG: cyclic nucleotide-binding domain-containing protein [Pyrinomonadaceae bacterium]|nr:cyclic nucleotide-binding domain-containing protein [Pyrinomonadaceae bacterium]
MAVASPRPPATPTRASLPVVVQTSVEADAEWWVEPVKWVALAVFIIVPIFALLVQPLAGRVVWTIVVAALPLFIVLVGYHRWRRICPLAFFAQIPVRLRRPGTRKASDWLEHNYYYVAFTVFFVSLWLRLIATNGDGLSIATFFVLITLAALIFGALFTGKTWCNYICPLSFIEKIYTEPHGLRETNNSQCTKCTACKKSCPDINEENGYWKEIESRAKRFVYFAFPGLIFGFYFYYYMQSGTWSYYFGGSWTHEPGMIWRAFLPGSDAQTAGFFFLPVVPRAIASLLTLAACGMASYLLFGILERYVGVWLKRRDAETDAARVRHVMFTLAAFTAFLTFYTFAGAPTLWRLPWVFPHLFLIAVALTATLFLTRRLSRRQKEFAEETLGRSIIKRWAWTDMQPPKDLHEAFLIHTIRAKESARGEAHVLEAYKDAVRETVDNGFVTREEVQLLESLRNQLHIKKADHEKVMSALAEEERALISDPTKQISAEKRLQLETYARALERYLQRGLGAEGGPDDSFIQQLRDEYRVTKDEHAAVLDDLMGGEQGMASRVGEEISLIERAAQTIQALERKPAPTNDFLAELLRRRRARSIDRLMRGLSFTLEDEAKHDLRKGLSSSNDAERESVIESLRAIVPPAVAERILAAYRESISLKATLPTLTDMLYARTRSVDPFVRAVALYALCERDAVDTELLSRMMQDEHELVRETARIVIERAMSVEARGTTALPLGTVEKMIALRGAPVFSRLAPEHLVELARASREDFYDTDESLCVEGESGNEVFILLSGEVSILRRDDEGEDRLVGTEGVGTLIGEMAVLDPSPRAATVIATAGGVRVLRLNGEAFREALEDDPAIASGVIRTLAQRLRAVT